MTSDSKEYLELRQEAFKMFIEAWEMKEGEISEATDREIVRIEAEITKVKKDLIGSECRIEALERENDKLELELEQVLGYNQKLKSFKENLKKSLSTTGPIQINYKSSLSSSPNSQRSSVNGRDFFREAKLRLSFEAFAVFFGYVKRLNDKLITKERALSDLKDVFGFENADLYEDFSRLLLRKSPEEDDYI